MAQVTVTINSREYGIACGDGQEAHIIKLSRMLDEKAKRLISSSGQINENMLLAIVGLLIADELEDAKKGIAHVKAPEPQVVEKIVEVEKVVEVEKIVEVEKVVEVEKPIEKIVEKIIEVEKVVNNTPDLDNLDKELSSSISKISESLKSVLEELQKL
jgi:cell division protein ZapA